MNKKYFIYHAPIILYLIMIFILSSIPGDDFPEIGFELNDKIIHAGVYFLAYPLFYLSLSNLEKENIISKNPLVFSLIFTNLYGIFDEFHQLFVPFRSAEFFDFLADLAGSLLGLISVILFNSYIKPFFLKQKLTG